MSQFVVADTVARRHSCYLGLTNLVETATVTAASEATAYPATNLQTHTTHDTWKPASSANAWRTVVVKLDHARPVNCWGIAGHNMNVAGGVSVQYSTDGTTYTALSSPSGSVAPPDRRPVMRVFSPVIARWWRFVFHCNGSTLLAVGNLFVGEALQMPKSPDGPFVAPSWDDDDDILNQRAEGGAFLGRSVRRRGGRGSASWSNLPAQWVHDNWRQVMDHCRTNPFWFSWDGGDQQPWHDEEAAFCWTDKPVQARYVTKDIMSVGLSYQTL